MTVMDGITVVPANEATWEDLQAIFGTRGSAAICRCQRYKLAPTEAFSRFPAEERALRMRDQANIGQPKAAATSGLVAYLDDEPVGWVAVEPRPAYSGLLRVYRVPWEGRHEDKADDGVWSVTCIFDAQASAAAASPTSSCRRPPTSLGSAARARSRDIR